MVSFLLEHAPEALEYWNDKENQQNFSKFFTEKSTEQTDINTPKKAKSAYMFFCTEERQKIKKEKSELKGKEITKELSVRWKLLKENKDKNILSEKQTEQILARLTIPT